MRIDDTNDWVIKCTGCMGCVSICPRRAIGIEESKDGFNYPVINDNLCVDCGLCKEVCHIGKPLKMSQVVDIMSAKARDNDIRKISSSGGIVYYLYKEVIRTGGVVYGAYFDEISQKVKHGSTDSVELNKLLRSKYVQSEIGNSFIQIADQLKIGRTVLFVGNAMSSESIKIFLTNKENSRKINYC